MESKYQDVYAALPPILLSEIARLTRGYSCGIGGVSEIRLMRGGRSSVIINKIRHRLYTVIAGADIEKTFISLCKGAVYAHRDTVTEGYITVSSGVRVGVCGQAAYNGGELVGVSDISALIFRFPTASSGFGNELYDAFLSCKRGLLIYSRAGVGKTTALRTLAPIISQRQPEENVTVIDERCEFDVSECERAGVTLLRGYKRSVGIEIALRTLGAGVIVIDEIGSAECSGVWTSSLLSGIKFVATAHAQDGEELRKRDGIEPLVRRGIFDVFFGIRYTPQGYSCLVEKNECLKL